MSANKAWLRALEATARVTAEPAMMFPEQLDALAERWGERPALLSKLETLSYRALAERARAYARWAASQGLGPGDVVALLMPNRPDYLALWAGISRTGAVVALLNTNLTGEGLAHAIKVAGVRTIVVASELQDDLAPALPDHEPTTVWVRGAAKHGHSLLDPAEYDAGPITPRADRETVGLGRTALYIYTSGTTGWPKAAKVSHGRLLTWCAWFSGMMNAGPEDRLYNCLPMYHSVGGVVATGAMLLAGGSVQIAEKFSAGRFWPEVVESGCTVFQYIGELCRYLTAAPPHPDERRHRLRLACGNGMREAVWREFQERFAVPQVLEFYAATEGTFSLYNAEGRPGAIGRVPGFLAHRFPAALIRLDPASGEPERGPDGFCIRCGTDEEGEAIGRVAEGAGAPSRFEGYTDAAASERKLLPDVFAPGDAWMRTGDLMRRDAEGFFYFVDRLGETFRWKGENVSTAEVADVVAGCPGVRAAAVYGVEVPGTEGRAGMAAVEVGPAFSLTALQERLAAALPVYAKPLFVRVVESLDATGTFKLKSGGLQAEGYDPGATGDPIHWWDPAQGRYAPMDAAAFARIQAGEVRF